MLTNSILLSSVGLVLMQTLLFVTSLFLILLILVQRGKGGGLTGALGGMGGQSAFGSRAGDAFTKITIVTAVIWITLCMVTIAAFNRPAPPKTALEVLDEQTGDAVSVGGEGDTQATGDTLNGADGEDEGAGAAEGEPAPTGDGSNALDGGLLDPDLLLPARDGAATESPQVPDLPDGGN